jgi:large subunit ribosomal protein L18
MERRFRIRNKRRIRKVKRIRKRLQGTSERPRLSVHRSCKQIYVQAIDDFNGATLASSSSVDKELKGSLSGTKSEVARVVGESIAKRLTERGVKKAVFDRGWYHYHGRIKALADGARKAGLEF